MWLRGYAAMAYIVWQQELLFPLDWMVSIEKRQKKCNLDPKKFS